MALATLRDITDRKLIEAKILRMARYDGLTGLANRAAFLERLNLALARARRSATLFAILYLDLDHFKDVNDTLGHPIGDSLLRAVADRLEHCVRETDLVARFGGDEFAVLRTRSMMPPASASGDKIRMLCHTYSIWAIAAHHRQHSRVPYSAHRRCRAMMMKADLAPYRAKDEGRNQFRSRDRARSAVRDG